MIKKNLFTIYLLGLHILLVAVLVKPDLFEKVAVRLGFEVKKPEIRKQYHVALSSHIRMDGNLEDGVTVFIGNSHTEGLAVSSVISPSVNYGIGTDTTVGVLNRLSYYKSLSRAKMLVLEIGYNDLIRRDDKAILENISKIIKSIDEPLPIVVNAIFPVDEKRKRITGLNKRIAGLNKQIREICVADPRLYFLDAGKMMTDQSGNLLALYHEGDGVHLSSKGYAVWIAELKKMIKQHN